MSKIKVGTIVNTFGLRGELKVRSFTDFPEERFKSGATVYLEQQGQLISMTIDKFRENKGMVLLQFKGMTSINDVEKYKTCDLYVHLDQLHQLQEGEFYFFELIDFEIEDVKGNLIGKVVQMEEGTTCNYLRIRKNDGETGLIPFMKPFIIQTIKEKKKIIVKLIEGLL